MVLTRKVKVCLNLRKKYFLIHAEKEIIQKYMYTKNYIMLGMDQNYF